MSLEPYLTRRLRSSIWYTASYLSGPPSLLAILSPLTQHLNRYIFYSPFGTLLHLGSRFINQSIPLSSVRNMAIFSRKKSKAKKDEEEDKKNAAKTAATPAKPLRGRNGKIIAPTQALPSDPMHDIPAPSKLPRDFHSPQIRQQASNHDRSYSFEEDHVTNDKNDFFGPHSSGDSGYASPDPDSKGHSGSTPGQAASQLTLGEELAQEPAFADHSSESSDRQQANSNKPLKASRSLQTLQQHAGSNCHSSPANVPHQQYQYQDGRQQRLIQQCMPMRPSSVPAHALQPKFDRMQSLPAQRNRSSRNADNIDPSSAPGEYTPSLNILNGLKVNKKGLILNEEGDPIGELVEGDILDCVREKANAHGDVLDEYGRVVGKVRTLPMRPARSTLRRSVTSAGTWEQHRDTSPPPPLRALRPAETSTQLYEGQQLLSGPLSPSLPTRNPGGDDYIKQETQSSTTPSSAGELETPQSQAKERATQQETSTPNSSVVGSSLHRSESLPSVPETHSTAEIALSDDGSIGSGSAQQATLEAESQAKQVLTRHINKDSSEQPQFVMDTDRPGPSKSVAFAASPEENSGLPTTMPAFGRSVSEQALSNMGLPPVPQVPRNFLENRISSQPAGLFTPSNRAKAAPLPAFPGRGLTVGLAGGGFNGPMPGMQNRRLTAPAYASQGMSSLNPQSSLARSRTSAPLVRSPLSSHGKSCQYTITCLLDTTGRATD